MGLKIALDYDNTFTADKDLFSDLAHLFMDSGHDVKFVTYRFEKPMGQRYNDDIEADAKKLGIEIVYCNYTQKSEVYQADIWIDDMPVLIPSMDMMKAIVVGELDT